MIKQHSVSATKNRYGSKARFIKVSDRNIVPFNLQLCYYRLTRVAMSVVTTDLLLFIVDSDIFTPRTASVTSPLANFLYM